MFQQFEDAKKASGKYLKLAAGEKRTLQFNPNKIEITDSEFEGKKTGGKSIHFTVIDPKEPQTERVLVDGRERNLLYLTVRGATAAIYLEEGFLSGSAEYSAMYLLLGKIHAELPIQVVNFLRKFIAITDRNSSNIVAHFVTEHMLENDLFDTAGMLDFGSYSDKNFKRMFLNSQILADKIPGYKGADERFCKELEKLVQDPDVIESLGLTEDDLDQGFKQVEQQYQQLKKQLRLAKAGLPSAASPIHKVT